MKKNNFLVCSFLVLIIAIGFWLRSAGIISNSFAFTYDVGRDILAVRNIVVNHKISLIGQTTGTEGIFYGPLWYWILTIPFVFSSGDLQKILFFMVLGGIVTVIIGYKLGKKIAGVRLGIFIASLISFSHFLIGTSAQLWNPNLIPLLVIILLYILLVEVPLHSSKYNLFKYSFLIGLLLGIIIEMEIVFGILIVLGTIFSSLVLIKRRNYLVYYLLLAVGIILTNSPKIIFDLRHNFIISKNLLKLISNPSGLKSLPLLDNLLNRTKILFNLFSDTVVSNQFYIALFLLLFSLLILIIKFKELTKAEKNAIKIIVITIATFLVGLTFFSHDIWPHYIIGLSIYYILFVAMALNSVAHRSLKPLMLAIIIIISILNIEPVKQIQNLMKPVWEGDAAVYRNQLAVVDYVYHDANKRKFNYIAYTPPIYDYTWKYLFLWYGDKKYHYQSSKENVGLLYMILEPDYENPNRLTNWLELRKNDGRVIKEKTVKGGILVQTRVRNL